VIDTMRGLLKPLWDRMHMAVQLGRLAMSDDAAALQLVQITTAFGDTKDGVPRYQNYGHTSVAPAGSQAVLIAIGGLRQNGLVIVLDGAGTRPTGLQEGESALYDDQGQTIKIGRDGIVIDGAGKKITVQNVPEINGIPQLVGDLTITGNLTVSGTITDVDGTVGITS
jgi:phage baseplate assembly protein V